MWSVRGVVQRGFGGMQRLMGPETAYAAGKRYKERGQYRDALDGFVQAHAQWQAKVGAEDARTVNALVQGATCRLNLGDLTTATDELNSALRLRAANPDAKHMPSEADIKNQLDWIAQQEPS